MEIIGTHPVVPLAEYNNMIEVAPEVGEGVVSLKPVLVRPE